MKLTSFLWREVYWRVCRTYARHIVRDRPADTIMRTLGALYFFNVHRYWPHLHCPRSFQEKIWNRKLFDRDPLWTMLSDKFRARDYVSRKAGSEYLIPLLWHGDKPEEIPFDKLPMKFVIKANHGCGYNIIVQDKTRLDHGKATRQIKKWLAQNFCQDMFLGTEWGYKNIRPVVMVESFLDDGGSAPIDYKFLCYSGKVEFLKVDFARFENHSERFFDKNLKVLNFVGRGIKEYRGEFELPSNYEDMVRVAEALSQDIDFVRVDLYNVGGRIYFGEITCYHGGGLIRLSPRKYDFLLGEKWKVKNELLRRA